MSSSGNNLGDAIAIAAVGISAGGYILLRARSARHSLATGCAETPVDFFVMKRIAQEQFKRRALLLAALIAGLLLVVGSNIDDLAGYFLVVPGITFIATVWAAVRRLDKVRNLVTKEFYNVVTDGRRVFVQCDGRLLAWFFASDAVITSAGIPAAKLRRGSGSSPSA